MKTAEKWAASHFDGLDKRVIEDIRAIQLEAMREGACRAALICDNISGSSLGVGFRSQWDCRAEILNQMSKWTIEDL